MSAIEQVQNAWKQAAAELGFEFVAPFTLENAGRTVEFHGLVRKFGGSKGTLFIASEHFDVGIGPAPRVAQQQGYFFSRINAKVYSSFDRKAWIEVLTDWGYFGESGIPQGWFATAK